MLKDYYSTMVIKESNGIYTLISGNFEWSPSRDILLTDVEIIKDEDGILILHGYEREYDFIFEKWGMFADPDDYCIDEEDYYQPIQSWFQKLFNIVPDKVLKDGWYRMKHIKNEVLYTFNGNFVEVFKK
jgi:hypothetical protein